MAVSLVLTTAACDAPIPIASDGVGTYPASIISAPPCDGRAAATPYATFAAAFNAGHFDQAAAQFGGADVTGGDQIWWDPSDPRLLGMQGLGQLPDHFAKLYQFGVRLPPTIEPNPLGDLREFPGFGEFDFNDHGFSGRGVVVCQTAKIADLYIDGWTPAIAGQAPPGVDTPPCVDGVVQNCHSP